MKKEKVLEIIDSIDNWSDICPFKGELKRKIKNNKQLTR